MILNFKDWSRLYEEAKLDNSGKTFYLLSGPSATGKTYLASESEEGPKLKHWTSADQFDGDCFITTDGADGESNKLAELLESKGLPGLAKIHLDPTCGEVFSAKEYYPNHYAKWKEEATKEELELGEELFSKCTIDNMTCPNTRMTDPRVWKIFWIARLWGPGRIVFDDVRPTIKKLLPGVKQTIIYTPITTYLGENLVKRKIKEGKMNVGDKLERYFEWFELSAKPVSGFPDEAKYTLEEIEESAAKLGATVQDFIRVTKPTAEMQENGFYLKTGGVQGSAEKAPVLNSRSGQALELK